MVGRYKMVAASLLALVLVAAVGCGDDDGGADNDTPPPVARQEDFPKPAGRTLAQLRSQLDTEGPVVAPAVHELEPGRNRFGFGLFDRARNQIAKAAVALYVAPAGGGEAKGPFLARFESLEVKSQYQSQTVAADDDAARSLYVADLQFPKPGSYEVLAAARLDDALVAATPAGPPLKVVKDSKVPEVGEPALRTHTPTETDVGGDLAKIDTRVPPSDMHEEDLADVLGEKPAVLLFATPQLCQSRVCGPVVDVAQQVKTEHGGDAAWIHMEIYRDNELEKGFRPQVLQWRLPTEPWAFTIDKQGRVAARLEGAFSAKELQDALRKATR